MQDMLQNKTQVETVNFRGYTKTIRQLGLVVYERIVNSGFAFVDYSLKDNSTSLSNC